jgi:hypothetical protein
MESWAECRQATLIGVQLGEWAPRGCNGGGSSDRRSRRMGNWGIASRRLAGRRNYHRPPAEPLAKTSSPFQPPAHHPRLPLINPRPIRWVACHLGQNCGGAGRGNEWANSHCVVGHGGQWRISPLLTRLTGKFGGRVHRKATIDFVPWLLADICCLLCHSPHLLTPHISPNVCVILRWLSLLSLLFEVGQLFLAAEQPLFIDKRHKWHFCETKAQANLEMQKKRVVGERKCPIWAVWLAGAGD